MVEQNVKKCVGSKIVNAISEALRLEVHKHNIRVTIIEPEFIDNITATAAKQALEARFKAITPQIYKVVWHIVQSNSMSP